MSRSKLRWGLLLYVLMPMVLVETGCPKTSTIAVPNFIGMSRSAAETSIASLGFALGTVTEAWSETALVGRVIGQDPAAPNQVTPGSPINLIVSRGPLFTGTEQTIMLPGDIPLEMVLIPAGTFIMGRYVNEQDSYSWENPAREVTVGEDFYLGKYEVTQAQWEAVMGNIPSFFTGEPNRPVERVSFYDVQEFIDAINGLGHGIFRLPSEAEWEYACRAGTMTRFYWGDDPNYTQIGTYAWYGINSATATHPVGQNAANDWGLYDMSGNVWEWCQDWWHDDYTGAPTDATPWESPVGESRVGRGGGWNSFDQYCRAAYRSYDFPENSANNIGFRLVARP